MSKTSSAVKNRYNAKAYDRVVVMVKKGQRDFLKTYAESQGKSLNAYINDLIMADMAAHSQSLPPSGTSGTEPEPETES